MAQIHWTSAISFVFNSPTFWSSGTVPGPADDAIIDALGANGPVFYTVTSPVNQTVLSIQTNNFATLDITGGTFNATAGTNGGVNNGVIMVENSTNFEIGGVFNGTGQISLFGKTSQTSLVISAANATLSGGGKVSLKDNPNNQIIGAVAGVTLTNIDDVIIGAGQIGSGSLILINDAAGTVEASGANSLIIDTGSSLDINSGLMEAATGTLVLQNSTIDQSGGGTVFAAYSHIVQLQGVELIGGLLNAYGTGAIETVSVGNLLDGLTSTVTNAGILNILDNTALGIEGAIANAGTISLLASSNATDLIVTGTGASLSGAGQIVLADNPLSVIVGAAATSLLDNANTISGAGQVGNGKMKLINRAAGVIDGTGTNRLVVNTGAQTLVNAGLIEATGTGGVTIASAVNNSGILEVAGGNMAVSLAVSGTGVALIRSGVITFASTFTGATRFVGNSGKLVLAQSQSYAGQVSGFSTHGTLGSDAIDLEDVAFTGAGDSHFTGTSASGVLAVTDGTHTARIQLTGDYTHAGFVTSSDGHGGTLVTLGKSLPFVAADSYSTKTSTTLNVSAALGVLANDSDTNGLTLSAVLAANGAPKHGALRLSANGAFIYVPTRGFTGQDSFAYIARDADGQAAPTTVTLFVGVSGNPITQPSFYNDGAGQTLNETAAAGVLSGDTDPSGLPMTATLVAGKGPTHGVLNLNADGSFTYTPTLGFAGTDTFDYVASDSAGGASAPTVVTLTVTAGAPSAISHSYGDAAGHPLTRTAATGVLAGDTDPNGLPLTAALAAGGGPTHGTLTLNPDGSFTYTPTLGFAGKDSFSYIASDSLAASASTLVTVTVTAGAPTALTQNYTDSPGHALTVNAASGVLAGDTDPNGLPLTAALAPGGGPTHGALTLNPDGSFTYTPTAGFAGKDSFSYIAADSLASSAPTLVTLTVAAGTPTALAHSYKAAAGHTLTEGAATGVLAGDTDPNGLPLTAALAAGGGPAHGTLTMNSDGSFTYTPTAGFAGKDSFSYVASDSLASSAPATVTLTVAAGTPTALTHSYIDTAGHTLTESAATGVLAGDTDPNGLPLTATLAPGGGPTNGTLTLNPDGSFTYTPSAGFTGKDSFSYVAADSLASSAPTLVTLTVSAAPPATKADAYSDAANHALNVSAAAGVLANDTDPNGLPLTAAIDPGHGPAHGTLTLNPNGSFTYAPTAGFAGTDSFDYIASDGAIASAPTLVTLTVTASRPAANPDGYTDTAGHVLTVNAATGLLANDSDPNGLPLTASLAAGKGPQHGTLSLNNDGSFTYTPDAGFAGSDSFAYIAADTLAASTPTLVTISVTAAPPVTHPLTFDAITNQTLNVDAAHGVLSVDSDPNGLPLTAKLAPGGAPEYGTVTLNTDGSFSYILNSGFGGFNGVDTFSYIASDGAAQSAPTTVTIDVSNGTAMLPGGGVASRTGASVLAQHAAGMGPAATSPSDAEMHTAAPRIAQLLAMVSNP